MARKRKASEVAEGPFPPGETPTEGPAATEGGAVTPPAAETPAPVEPVKPQHTKLAIRSGKLFGLDDASIERMSPEDLDDFIHEQQIALNAERRMSQAQSRIDNFDKPHVPTPAPATAPEEDLSEAAPWLQARLKRAEELEKREAEREARIAKVEKSINVQAENAVADQIDAVFESLPAEWRDVFGEGSARDMVGSPEQVNRAIVFNIAVQGLQALPGKATLKQKILAAANQQFGKFIKKTAAAAPAEPTGYEVPDQSADRPRDPASGRFTNEQWLAGTTLAPTARKSQELPPGKARMAQKLAERMRDREPALNGTVHDDDGV